MTIDWGALEEVREEHFAWRALTKRDDLSDVYVEGEGDNPQAFIIGEAPGAQEEARGRPFVGESGQVLRDLMAVAGLHTEEVQPNCWLTNVVKFRPARNRTPTLDEILSVRYILQAEWKAVGAPSLIIPVGRVAYTALIGRVDFSIMKIAGSYEYRQSRRSRTGKKLIIWPMIHPSAGLRDPSIRSAIERHWEQLGDCHAPHR